MKGSKKTIDVTIQAASISSDILKSALQEILANNATKHGKVKVKDLIESSGNGKLDSIEVTDSNIKDFLQVAKKYDVDYALKRDTSVNPPKYHVFFSTDKTDNFKKSFSEYVAIKSNQIDANNRGEMTRQQLAKQAEIIKKQPKKQKERVKERSEVR